MAPPEHHLPATFKPGALTTPIDSHLVPALIADAGEPAAWRYIEFFTANIRNPNTRLASRLAIFFSAFSALRSSLACLAERCSQSGQFKPTA